MIHHDTLPPANTQKLYYRRTSRGPIPAGLIGLIIIPEHASSPAHKHTSRQAETHTHTQLATPDRVLPLPGGPPVWARPQSQGQRY
jgi:hypothetical protein